MITLEFVKKIDQNWEKRIISENVANLCKPPPRKTPGRWLQL